MALHYSTRRLQARSVAFVCNSCGAAMAFYTACPSMLTYGL